MNHLQAIKNTIKYPFEQMSTLNSHWKNDKSGFGFRMLQKMGWKEDKGLGKNETGIVESIKVKKRDEGIGLGMVQSSDSAGLLGWNETVSSFNDVLKVLNENYGDKKKKKDKKDNSSSSKAKKTSTISLGLK